MKFATCNAMQSELNEVLRGQWCRYLWGCNRKGGMITHNAMQSVLKEMFKEQ